MVDIFFSLNYYNIYNFDTSTFIVQEYNFSSTPSEIGDTYQVEFTLNEPTDPQDWLNNYGFQVKFTKNGQTINEVTQATITNNEKPRSLDIFNSLSGTLYFTPLNI